MDEAGCNYSLRAPILDVINHARHQEAILGPSQWLTSTTLEHHPSYTAPGRESLATTFEIGATKLGNASVSYFGTRQPSFLVPMQISTLTGFSNGLSPNFGLLFVNDTKNVPCIPKVGQCNKMAVINGPFPPSSAIQIYTKISKTYIYTIVCLNPIYHWTILVYSYYH